MFDFLVKKIVASKNLVQHNQLFDHFLSIFKAVEWKSCSDCFCHCCAINSKLFLESSFGFPNSFENLNNRTSQKFHAKQQMEIS